MYARLEVVCRPLLMKDQVVVLVGLVRPRAVQVQAASRLSEKLVVSFSHDTSDDLQVTTTLNANPVQPRRPLRSHNPTLCQNQHLQPLQQSLQVHPLSAAPHREAGRARHFRAATIGSAQSPRPTSTNTSKPNPSTRQDQPS